ncbi:hypothetical protein CPB85DRAFT_1511892 [Mucidula mucida]|nr:hypothetical protein CPB85DRAFT_1511892 [Mucidula mucida]
MSPHSLPVISECVVSVRAVFCTSAPSSFYSDLLYNTKFKELQEDEAWENGKGFRHVPASERFGFRPASNELIVTRLRWRPWRRYGETIIWDPENDYRRTKRNATIRTADVGDDGVLELCTYELPRPLNSWLCARLARTLSEEIIRRWRDSLHLS